MSASARQFVLTIFLGNRNVLAGNKKGWEWVGGGGWKGEAV